MTADEDILRRKRINQLYFQRDAVVSDNAGTIQGYEGHFQGGATSAVAAASTFSSGTVTHDFGSNDIDGDGLKTCIIVWNPGDVADTLHGGWITIEKIT